MKPTLPSHTAAPTLAEDTVRDYAYHLYVQSGRIPGRDLDNWLEAEACICANIPKERAHVRLHRHTRTETPAKPSRASSEVKMIAA